MRVLLLTALVLGTPASPLVINRGEDGDHIETSTTSIAQSSSLNGGFLQETDKSVQSVDGDSHDLQDNGPSTLPASGHGRQLYSNTYQYYFQLWYLPMFFAVYFMVYVGALVIKGAARHKVKFPQVPGQSARGTQNWDLDLDLDLLTTRVTQALSDAAFRYMKRGVLTR